MKLLRWVTRHAALLALAVFLVGWLGWLRPSSLGGEVSYIFVSGNSMEPAMSNGDLALVRPRAIYEPGDVVAYRIPEGTVGAGSLVIHRIVGRDAAGYITQGDNREGRDLWRPHRGDVVGAPIATIPRLGWLLRLLFSPLVLGVLAAAGIFSRVAGVRLGRARHAPG